MDFSNFIQKICKEGSQIALKHFGKHDLNIKEKDYQSDIVTEADLAVNKYLVDTIRDVYPDHGFITEEMPAEKINAEYVWVIDPIDGTRNFATGSPYWLVMIALLHNGEVKYSTLSVPSIGSYYFAQKGKGAFHNNERIYCTTTEELDHSYGVGGTNVHQPLIAKLFKALAGAPERHIWMNGYGSSGMCAVHAAHGIRDWVIQSPPGVWDSAPGALLMKEAGCDVRNGNGKKWQFGDTSFIAANPKLLPKVLDFLGE